MASQEAGSRLIMTLCKANQTESALAVYDDMILASSEAAASSSSANSQEARPAANERRRSSFDKDVESDASDASLNARRTAAQHPTPSRPLSLSDMTAADRLGLRRNVLFEGDWAAAPTRRKERSSSKSFRCCL